MRTIVLFLSAYTSKKRNDLGFKSKVAKPILFEPNLSMQEVQSNGNQTKTFRKILYNSFIGALVGGALAFIALSASPVNALKFGSQGASSLHAGLGIVGFLGSIIWNFLISVLGAIVFGFTTAIGSLIYYSIPKKRKNTGH